MATDRMHRLDEAFHLRSSDSPARMLKADLRFPEMPMRAAVGQCIERTKTLAGLSLKEFATAVDRDERQVKRWFTGEERPHIDAIVGNSALRSSFAQAVAELTGQDVEVTVKIRRTA